jgi:hypothetical protein
MQQQQQEHDETVEVRQAHTKLNLMNYQRYTVEIVMPVEKEQAAIHRFPLIHQYNYKKHFQLNCLTCAARNREREKGKEIHSLYLRKLSADQSLLQKANIERTCEND